MDEHDLREALRSEAGRHAFDPATVGRAVERGRAHRRRRRTVLVAAVPVVALAAAGGTAAVLRDGPENGGPVAGPAGSPSAQALPLLTQRTQPEATMEALASGTVAVAENGCPNLAAGDGLTPIAWPAGWTAAVDEEGQVALYDADGNRRAGAGDEVQFAGGYQALTSLSGELVGPVECALGESSVFLAQGQFEVLSEAQTG